jgi:uncharacterized membrane protein YdjX (TVP38/TMEM64 family)
MNGSGDEDVIVIYKKLLIIKLVKFLLIILVVFLGYFFLRHTETGRLLSHGEIHSIAEHIRGFGTTAIFIMFFLVMLQAFFPYMPFIILAGVNVLLFGLYGGFILSFTATSVGSILTFLLARYWIRRWAERKIRHLKFMARFNAMLKTKGFYAILITRLTAVVPSSAINLATGLSRIKGRTFLIATLLGNLPVTFIESLLGHYVIHMEKQSGKVLFVIILIAVLFFFLKKRFNRIG